MNKKRILALLLAMVMLASCMAALTACGKSGSDEERIVGDWSCTVDLTDGMNQYLGQESPEMTEFINISDFAITLIWTFDDQGAVSVKADEEAMTAMMDGVADDMVNGMTAYLTSIAEENGMTLEQLMDATGMTTDDLAQQLRDNMAEEMDFSSMNQSAKYEFKDGLLYIDGESVEYAFDGENTLNFVGGEGMDSLMGAMEESGFFADVLPMVLKRV